MTEMGKTELAGRGVRRSVKGQWGRHIFPAAAAAAGGAVPR